MASNSKITWFMGWNSKNISGIESSLNIIKDISISMNLDEKSISNKIGIDDGILSSNVINWKDAKYWVQSKTKVYLNLQTYQMDNGSNLVYQMMECIKLKEVPY